MSGGAFHPRLACFIRGRRLRCIRYHIVLRGTEARAARMAPEDQDEHAAVRGATCSGLRLKPGNGRCRDSLANTHASDWCAQLQEPERELRDPPLRLRPHQDAGVCRHAPPAPLLSHNSLEQGPRNKDPHGERLATIHTRDDLCTKSTRRTAAIPTTEPHTGHPDVRPARARPLSSTAATEKSGEHDAGDRCCSAGDGKSDCEGARRG